MCLAKLLATVAFLGLVTLGHAGTLEVRFWHQQWSQPQRQSIVCDLLKIEGTSTQVVGTVRTKQNPNCFFNDLEPAEYKLRAHLRDRYLLSTNFVVAAAAADGPATVVNFKVSTPPQTMVTTFRSHIDLPTSNVRKLVQGYDGTLWAISHLGLLADIEGQWRPTSLVGINVFDLGASATNLLAYTSQGIYEIRPGEAATRITTLGVKAMPEDRQRLAVRPDGAFLYSVGTNLVFYQEGEETHLSVPGQVVRIQECEDGSFLIMTAHTIWHWRSFSTEPRKVFTDASLNLRSITADETGRCWVYGAGNEEGVILSHRGDSWFIDKKILPQAGVSPWALAVRDGVIWISNAGRLTRIENDRIVDLRLPHSVRGSNLQLSVLATDSEVWVGGRAGIHQVFEHQKYLHNQTTGIVGLRPRSIANGPDGRLWALSYDRLNLYQDGTWHEFAKTPKPPPHLYSRFRPSILVEQDEVWISTWGGLFKVAGDQLVQPADLPAPLRSPIDHLGTAPDGFSASTGNQMFRYETKSSTWRRAAKVPAEIIPAVAFMWVDPDGVTWASDGKSTASLRQGAWQPEDVGGLSLRFPPHYGLDGSRFTCTAYTCVYNRGEDMPRIELPASAGYRVKDSSIGKLVSTSNGLYVFRDGTRWHLAKTGGLPSRIVYDAIFDGERLWVSTSLGMVELEKPRYKIRPPDIAMISKKATSTKRVHFKISTYGEAASVTKFAGAHHSASVPDLGEADLWQRVPLRGAVQYMSSRTGRHHFHAYTENVFGQRSDMAEASFKFEPAPDQAARRIRNAIILALGISLILLTLWGWLRQRTLLKREAASRRDAETAAHEAKQANQAKSRFLANVSHELSALAIQHGGRHLLSVINNVISLSQIESGGTTLHPEPFGVRAMLSEIHGQLEHLAKKKGLTLDIDIADNTPEVVVLDPGKLRQILVNLVGNGIKYTETGGVVLRCREEHDQLRFDIEDTGGGIPEALRQDLFSPFARGRAHANIEGDGLGLALSRALADTMGGGILLERSSAAGSVFTLRLPFTPSTLLDLPKPEQPADPNPSAITGNVLIVDDESPNRKLFSKMIAGLNLEIRLAEDGMSAVEMARDWRPDIVLMDLRLPDISGEQAAHQVREHWIQDPPWITCLSADVFGLDKDDASSPFNDFLSKPIRKKALNTHIREVLARQQGGPPSEPV